MGIFKNVFKKVALAAVVIAGKRILNKVVADVMDGDKQPPEETAVAATDKPKTASGSRRRTAAKPRNAGGKAAVMAKKEAEASADDKPKKPSKPRTRKPRTTKPKVMETKSAEAESQVDTVAEQQPVAMENISTTSETGASEASNR